MPEVRFDPLPKQLAIWETLAEAEDESTTFIGYGGAAGGGKSRAIAELAFDLAMDFPGNRILVGRKDYKDLRTTTMEEFYRCVPKAVIARQNDSEHWCWIRDPRWPPGIFSQVFFSELKDYLSLGSEEYGAVLIDEAGEVPIQSALMLVSRIRWKPRNDICPPMKYVFMAGSNPWPGWFEDWFVKKELPEELLEVASATVHFLPAYIRDNKHLPKNYEAMLRAIYPEEWVARMVEGRFDVYEGQVYPQISHDMIWPYALPPFKRIIGGLDFGGAGPKDHMTAGVIGGVTALNTLGVPENTLIRFGHFEDRGPGVYKRLVAWMIEQEKASGHATIDWRADKTQMWGIDLVHDLLGLDVSPSKGGPGSVEGGIVLVGTRMSDGGSLFTPNLLGKPSIEGRSWYDRMREYLWDLTEIPGSPMKREPFGKWDDTPAADRYMHEALDAFPTVARRPGVQETTLSGNKRATVAV